MGESGERIVQSQKMPKVKSMFRIGRDDRTGGGEKEGDASRLAPHPNLTSPRDRATRGSTTSSSPPRGKQWRQDRSAVAAVRN